MYSIYKIVNTVNGKVYIGQTSKDIYCRMSAHMKAARKRVNRRLYDAMNKYGVENFTIDLIEKCTKYDADDKEIYWIAFYDSTNPNNGYNMTPGGGGGNTWESNDHKEETIKKILKTKTERGIFQKYPHNPNKMKGKHYLELPSKEELLRDLLYPLDVARIASKWRCSKWTITQMIKNYFENKTAHQIRREHGIALKQTEKQVEALRMLHINRKRLYGKDNPSFKFIDKNELLSCIIEGKPIDYMINLFGVSKPTLIHRCKDLFGKSIRDMRREYNER